jgi:hypothetical protein
MQRGLQLVLEDHPLNLEEILDISARGHWLHAFCLSLSSRYKGGHEDRLKIKSFRDSSAISRSSAPVFAGRERIEACARCLARISQS